ncbi:SusD/RagB family nutrient-binding outer membrane lipoprotein [Autumnicola psychrophila]|uniref:SusD/RagB family nutrient-binding outer membrane lipoprotein n=1 Tax=Autumnicola psychrophila TaxID=3075592 RepID=A0ABU3DMV3_9FLAO|nr:SusD/RagB family nutrient-binding outer membrane lipoprotein [Zunongwangia sp. F225]MDT0685011.1 SusD/RagB family nutrient-binding outer membrane lipoprotein [Zunongwangia sp. F225]
MKITKQFILLFVASLLIVGCDDDFVEVNTDPYAVNDVDPALLFGGAQRIGTGSLQAENTIVQQFVNPYNQGATLGFNFNADIDGVNNGIWNDAYGGDLRNIIQALNLLDEDTERTNLENMIRIWKAHIFMRLVDTYGDVPYFEAGRAVSDIIFYPVYDDDEIIYENLHAEITDAVASFNPNGEFVSEDLFYGENGSNPTNSASAQVEKWRKLGNSLLLRLGMRYSELNPSKAESIVSEALNGGVMTSNDDNAYIVLDGIRNVNGRNNLLRDFPFFYYAAEPFVDQLKSTNDPRGTYILATYDDPGAIVNDPEPDTDLDNQFGVPIGVTDVELRDTSLGYRGARGAGLDYSQFNVYSVLSPAAPEEYVTYPQTALLLAEAAYRGWIDGDAQEYYEEAITAHMQMYEIYPNTASITMSEIESYLNEPEVAYDESNALELINTQYWIVSFTNAAEAFANFRRSGYPNLNPNTFNDDLVAGGGFANRFSYPDRESSANAENYSAAAAAIGGDNLISRVFWDIE